MIDAETIKEFIKLGAKAPDTIDVPGGCEPIISIPIDQKIITLAPYLPPQYISQSPKFQEAGSFIEYVNRFKTDDTLIFCQIEDNDTESVIFRAVIDYHGKQADGKPAPHRCRHVASYHAIFTPEWLTWDANNDTLNDQVTFATFLEDNQKIFVEPKGAELLELVRSLHGHKNARFSTSVRLDNGAHSCEYEEDIVVRSANTTKAGAMPLPSIISAAIPVFQGGDHYKVEARLKTRIDERKLFLFYQTINRPTILRESIMSLVKQIANGTKIVPLLGTYIS